MIEDSTNSSAMKQDELSLEIISDGLKYLINGQEKLQKDLQSVKDGQEKLQKDLQSVKDGQEKSQKEFQKLSNQFGEIETKVEKLSRLLDRQKDKMELIDDRIKIIEMTPQIPYSSYYPMPVAPTGRALSETRSRWKRGWFHYNL